MSRLIAGRAGLPVGVGIYFSCWGPAFGRFRGANAGSFPHPLPTGFRPSPVMTRALRGPDKRTKLRMPGRIFIDWWTYPSPPLLDSSLRWNDEMSGGSLSRVWSPGHAFIAIARAGCQPAHQGLKCRGCGLVPRIGTVDSATPHPVPSGGQAPALHFLIPPSTISLQFGTFRRWRAGIEVDGRAHPGSESGTCFRTNRPCRLVPAHQGMKMRPGRWRCLGVVGAALPLWIPAFARMTRWGGGRSARVCRAPPRVPSQGNHPYGGCWWVVGCQWALLGLSSTWTRDERRRD